MESLLGKNVERCFVDDETCGLMYELKIKIAGKEIAVLQGFYVMSAEWID